MVTVEMLELYAKVKSRISALYLQYSIVCDALPNPANGGVFARRGIGDTATYYCDYGYDLIGDSTVTCQSNGTWLGLPPTCEG